MNNPKQILDIIPIYANRNSRWGQIIDAVHRKELGLWLDDNSQKLLAILSAPIDGDFIEVKSKHGELCRKYTSDEAEWGLCSRSDVNKIERTIDGEIKIYNSIKVFIRYSYDSEIGEYRPVRRWFPEDRYNIYLNILYRYYPISKLNQIPHD